MKRIVPICRSLFDRVVALLLLFVLAPSLALVAFLLRTTGRGTTAFRSIGHFLRSYSIDEFPGLWAIVRGQISLMQFFWLARIR